MPRRRSSEADLALVFGRWFTGLRPVAQVFLLAWLYVVAGVGFGWWKLAGFIALGAIGLMVYGILYRAEVLCGVQTKKGTPCLNEAEGLLGTCDVRSHKKSLLRPPHSDPGTGRLLWPLSVPLQEQQRRQPDAAQPDVRSVRPILDSFRRQLVEGSLGIGVSVVGIVVSVLLDRS